MPLYEYRCQTGHTTMKYLPLAEYDVPQQCKCGLEASKILGVSTISIQSTTDYTCPVTGKPITTRKAHEENLKRHGCRVLEKGENENASKYKAREEAIFEKRVEDTAEEFVHSLSTDKREQLGRELEYGLNLSVERKGV